MKTLLAAAKAACFLCLCFHGLLRAQPESLADHNARMSWWREARFGLFIHWGLYAIPAGEWRGKTNYGEWIRTSAEIPLEEYDRFVARFNPVRFDARAWVRTAKQAGMKYIVITSKHHDGFCLFDSQHTDFDVMSTPFRRDILKELADACRAEGLKMCWYHSIMDWHHPDYLPRREWEQDRPTEGARFARYVEHLKNQLRELLTNYGPIGVLWFDGEWESTWNDSLGRDLYTFVRKLQPDILVNNRVGAGRSGMEGFTKAGEFGGDFGTPEQQIPPTGLPGVDWETCMTMNDHWGYNSHDQNWKSGPELIRMLADIASKGGNFLLNVGPTAEGVFPRPSIDRLAAIGRWMEVNGESIYGSSASPFRTLPWGRCTRKEVPAGTRLYMHVFDWPATGRLVIPGIFNVPKKASLLTDGRVLKAWREQSSIVIELPPAPPDSVNSVVVLEVDGKPDISDPPDIDPGASIFIDSLSVVITSNRQDVQIRYTTDGSVPTAASPVVTRPIVLRESATVMAICFRQGMPVSGPAKATVSRVVPLKAVKPREISPGLAYTLYGGEWDSIPAFSGMSPVRNGVANVVSCLLPQGDERFGIRFQGFLKVPQSGVFTFGIVSDDGSRLSMHGKVIIDNDGAHAPAERIGHVALEGGLHPVRIEYFERTGGNMLELYVKGPGMDRRPVPGEMFFHGE